MDGHEDAENGRAPLHYPYPEPPAPGTAREVAPGVHWVRMPLPFALDHINLWVLDDGPAWTVVDTGLRNEKTSQLWRELFAGACDRRPVGRVLVTHMHPDHVGMAGWLTRKFGARLWMTAAEYLTCRVMVSDTGREAPPEAVAFYTQAGWSEAAIETYRTRFGNFGKAIHPLPDAYRRLEDGEELTIGPTTWRVIVGTGHSPAHACLYCPSRGLLISGDQVLPRISSNVSVYPVEPDADPLAGWLASLDRLRREVPDDVLVLPSHNEPFRGLHARIDALRQGHERALQRLREALRTPRRAVDVFGVLFKRPITEQDVSLLGMATGESLASLNYLIGRGEVERSVAADGTLHYRLRADAGG